MLEAAAPPPHRVASSEYCRQLHQGVQRERGALFCFRIADIVVVKHKLHLVKILLTRRADRCFASWSPPPRCTTGV